MKHRFERLLGACLVLLAAGCAGIGTSIGGDHIRWIEEVKLSDGSVIQIQRHAELTGSGFPVDKRGSYKYHEICYPPLGIHWKSRGGYRPDIFDIVDGKAYIHVPVSSQLQCYEQGSPDHGAIYFVWEQGRWQRIEREAFPARSEWNLLMQTSGGTRSTDPKGLVALADKDVLDRDLHYFRSRDGWKRTSESQARSEGCRRHGKGWCVDADCQYVTDKPREPLSIFHPDTSNTCQ